MSPPNRPEARSYSCPIDELLLSRLLLSSTQAQH